MKKLSFLALVATSMFTLCANASVASIQVTTTEKVNSVVMKADEKDVMLAKSGDQYIWFKKLFGIS